MNFEGSLGFSFYPARQLVVEQAALADEEFLLSLEPLAAAAPPQSSTGHMYQLCLSATGHKYMGAAETRWRKLEENMNANRNHQAFTVLPLTHRHPGSSSDATKEKKGMLMASNRRRKKQGDSKCFQQTKPIRSGKT